MSGANYYFVLREFCPMAQWAERLEVASLAGDLTAVIGERPSSPFGVIPLRRVEAERLFGWLAVVEARHAAVELAMAANAMRRAAG